MVEAEGVEQRGVEVVDVHGVLRDVEAEVVGRAVDVPAFQAAAGEPHREAAVVVVAAVVAALHHRGAAELAAPDDERIVEEAALFEVGDEGGAGPVGIDAVFFHILGEIAVLIPGLVKQLHKAHAAFDEAASEEAIAGVVGLLDVLDAVEFEDVRWL